ncbi:acyl-coenzyme A synthetase/AMP-(fatty) acid ligase/thioesterase domain-containing protein/acyl carrier protein [Rhodococcus sp. 27YEA15]|uniref:alpha/beta fold hydrolase n=1 Tax=Rhodococcus sp. 27YEA15 TaxID=3156259 RepID=UPI003C7DE490
MTDTPGCEPAPGTLPVPWGSVRERFDEAVAEFGDVTAVVCKGRSLTYTELGTRAHRSARALLDHLGPRRGAVAIDTDNSLECVQAIVTVLISGRPLVLLDSQLPQARRDDILARSGATAVSAADLTRLPAAPDTELPAVSAADCAVFLFTSGSTGRPKGVVQGNRLWLNQAADFRRTLGIAPGMKIGMALPISFGGGMDVVMFTLLNGATLHFLDPRESGIDSVPDWIADEDLDTLHATPSLLRAILAVCEHSPALAGLSLVTTCGEAVHGSEVVRLRRMTSPELLYCNLSGSSETGNLAFNLFPSTRSIPDRILPAGEVATNKVIRLVDSNGEPVPVGATGAIVVESTYIAEGYALAADGVPTADQSRFGRTPGSARTFSTGDLGRFDADGTLHLLGRGDDTVKVRGYLVAPAEVESALRRIPGLADAVVVARTVDDTVVLVGYAATESGTRAPSVADVRGSLLRALPSWMVPTHLVLLPTLPRNERGKVDRSALPAPATRPEFRRPTTRTEISVAAAWSDALGLDAIGLDDDFAALGGDSLQTQQMLTRIRAEFGVDLTSASTAEYPTVQRLADHLDDAHPRPRGSILVPLRTSGHLDPIFAFAGAGSTALALLPLARELGPDQPVYGLQAHGLENRGLPDWTIRRAARRFLARIRTVQPRGPYIFVGHSIGGVIAMDVARLLEKAGETVSAVVCLDTVLGGPLSVGGPALPRGAVADEPADAPPVPKAPDGFRLWRTRAQLLTAGIIRRPAQQQWDLFHEQGRRVALLHRLQPWDGTVHVAMARDNPDDPAWWSLIAPNVRTVERIRGDHVGILRAPDVARTAMLVRNAIDEVRR